MCTKYVKLATFLYFLKNVVSKDLVFWISKYFTILRKRDFPTKLLDMFMQECILSLMQNQFLVKTQFLCEFVFENSFLKKKLALFKSVKGVCINLMRDGKHTAHD